jgi:hypothetical protein
MGEFVEDTSGHSLLMLATLAPNEQNKTAQKIVELLIKHTYTSPS